MGRLNVFIPDALEHEMREAGVSPSEVLQRHLPDAIADATAAASFDEYLAELDAEVGPSTPEDEAWVAERLAPLFERRERDAQRAS